MGRPIRSFTPNDCVIPAALLALSLAACGTATVPSPIAPASQGAVTPATGSSQQRAKADAAWILASFVPPPGARRLSRAPAGVNGALDEAVSTGGPTAWDPDVVDDSSFWQVPGTPSGALAYEASHLPRQFHQQGGGNQGGRNYGIYGGPGFLVTYDDFIVQSGLGPVETGQLEVDSIASASGQTYVRVDAQVSWQPPRPAATFLPAGKIRAVVVTVVPDPNDTRKPPPPVTVTDPVKVGQLASLLNGLPLYPPGVIPSCPTGGWGLQMEFLAAAGGPRLATAYVDSGNCGGAVLLIGAGKLASRYFPSGGEIALGAGNYHLAPQAEAICGIRWGP